MTRLWKALAMMFTLRFLAPGWRLHSPAEALRILAEAVDLAGQARLDCARILARHGCTQPVDYPDLSTKEKAQTLVKQFAAGRPPKLLPEGK